MKKPTYVEVVVKVPKIKYEAIINHNTEWDEWTLETIRNGILLPKEHGDLIDRDECLKMKMTDLYDKDGITMYAVPTGNILRMKPIIVKTDKGE